MTQFYRDHVPAVPMAWKTPEAQCVLRSEDRRVVSLRANVLSNAVCRFTPGGDSGEADGPDSPVSTGSVRLTKSKHFPKTLCSLPEPLGGYLLILKVTDFKVTKISPRFADSAGMRLLS